MRGGDPPFFSIIFMAGVEGGGRGDLSIILGEISSFYEFSCDFYVFFVVFSRNLRNFEKYILKKWKITKFLRIKKFKS